MFRRPRVLLGVAVAVVALAVGLVVGLGFAFRVAQVAPASDGPGATLGPADAERYAGGIPRRLDGQPVLVGLDARLFAAGVPDSRPFLFGGSFTSQILQTCSGGIGEVDPNPLGSRRCPPWAIDGAPGPLHFPEGFEMPRGDGPIVIRAHTRDPRAATCLPANRDSCAAKVVVEGVAWFGDDTTATVPIGPADARGRVLRLGIAEMRLGADGANYHVPADVFTVPVACPAPWPAGIHRIHGDPRHGLLAVFPDVAARESFAGSVAPESAGACLGTTFARPGPGRWLAFENLLVLTFGDAEFVQTLDAAIRLGPNAEVPSVGLAQSPEDLGEETLFDYLAARGSGLQDHAWGERLWEPVGEDEDGYPAWTRDVLRRHAAGALIGDAVRLAQPPDAARIGAANVARLDEMRADRRSLFRVTYPAAADPDLAVEEFVTFLIPDSTFRDWGMIRVAGAPYPRPP